MTLRIATNSNGWLSGTAAAGAKIVIENKSLAPFAPNPIQVVTTADSAGGFRVRVPAGVAGDFVRVSRGNTHVDIRLSSSQSARRPEAELQGLRLHAGRKGLVEFSRVTKQAVIAEPFAELHFTKRGNQKPTIIQLDRDGCLPANAALQGKKGDVFDVAVHTENGKATLVGNVWTSLIVGEDSTPRAADVGQGRMKRVHGALHVDGIGLDDARQGDVGDCWLVAPLAALASKCPDAIAKMVSPLPDGSYVVRFHKYDVTTKRHVIHEEFVTPSFYQNQDDDSLGEESKLYGRGGAPRELWFALIEKAYAQWKGGYAAISCGYPYTAFELAMGAAGKHFALDGASKAEVSRTLKEAEEQGRVMVAVSNPDAKLDGLTPDHAYTVVGIAGDRVMLRNPWGHTEVGEDDEDDGVFTLTRAQFLEHFYYVCLSPRG
jgi:hypothetical protein